MAVYEEEDQQQLYGESAPRVDTYAEEPSVDPMAAKGPQQGYGSAIMGELVKSYGFKRNDQTGDMDWSVGNIADAFKESPVWTTIDWLTTTVPPLKWGVALARVNKGVTAAGRAYQAGRATKFEAVKSQLRAPSRGLGDSMGLAEAPLGIAALGTKALMGTSRMGKSKGMNRSAVWARGVENPTRFQVDDIGIAEVGISGGDEFDQWGRLQALRNEALAAQGAHQKKVEKTVRKLQSAGLSSSQMRHFTDLLESDTPRSAGYLAGRFGDEGAEAYERTLELRNTLHQDSYDLGLIGEETYRNNLNKYSPRVYEQMLDAEATAAEATGRAAGKAHFKKRTIENEALAKAAGLDRVLDPTVTVDKLNQATKLVATQKFLRRIADDSVVSQTAPDMVAHIQRLRELPANQRGMFGVSDDVLNKFDELQAAGNNTEEALSPIFEAMGFTRLDSVAGTKDMPEYWDRVANVFEGKWVDKRALDDIDGFMKFSEMVEPTTVAETYNWTQATFRKMKTVYNPATHIRNLLGNSFFNYGATGTVKLAPRQGWKAIKSQGQDYQEALEAGVVGQNFADKEIRAAFGGAYERAVKSGLDERKSWSQAIGDFAAKADQKAIDLYSWEDDVWKMDIFMTQRNKYMSGKNPLSRADAISRATADVARFTPSFMQASPLAKELRGHIPFSSFMMDGTRVWNNVMTEHPLRFFALTHFTDVLSQGSAAVQGITPDEYQAAKEQLPSYTKNKNMLLLPHTSDGKASFLDMSYLLPMANVGASGEMENMFFGQLSNNPVANVIAAAATNVDPFSGREVAPRNLEKLVGPIEKGRRALGIAEHIAGVLAPPLVPPGYAANNLIELARGEMDPNTGMLREPDMATTLASNLFGMRTYEGSVKNQLGNVRHADREKTKANSRWRKRWQQAKVDGDAAGMERALAEIRTIRESIEEGSSEAYIRRMMKRSEPGKYRGIGSRQLKETLARVERLRGDLSPEDRAIRGELMKRLQERGL